MKKAPLGLLALAATLLFAAPAEPQEPTPEAVLSKQTGIRVEPAKHFRQVSFVVHRQPVRRVLMSRGPRDFKSALWIDRRSPTCEYRHGTTNVFYCYGAGAVTRIVAVPHRPVVITASSMAARPVRITIRY